MQPVRDPPAASWSPSSIARYASAIAAVSFAVLLNLILTGRNIGPDIHYFALILAVIFSAVFFGLGPGLVATGISGAISAFLFLPVPFHSADGALEAYERLAIFLVEGILISVIGNTVRSADLQSKRGIWTRYLWPILFIATATVLKLVVFPEIAVVAPFTFFYVAICLSGWLGGAGPGLTATLLAAGVARFFFLLPKYSFVVADDQEAIRVALFVCEGILLAFLTGSHPKLRKALEDMRLQSENYRDVVRRGVEEVRALRSLNKDVLWEWDLQSEEIKRSTKGRGRLSGLLRDREEFSTWLDRIHPDDQPRVRDTLSQALDRGREDCVYNYRLLRPDGTYADVSDHIHIVRDAEWKPVRVIGRSAEFAARPQPSRPTQLNERRFAQMFEESPAAMLLTDADLKILTGNSAARIMLRAQSDGLRGANVTSFFDSDSRDEASRHFAALLTWEHVSAALESTCVRTTGETFRARLSAALITDFVPGSCGCLVIIEDLTEKPARD